MGCPRWRGGVGLTIGIGGLAAQGDDEFGAGIFEGACDSPGEHRLFDLGDLEIDDDDDDDRRRTPTIGGTPVAGPVYEEDEDLSATIDDLTAAPHVMLVFASDAADAPIAACGGVFGQADTGTLLTTLDAVDGSGVSGVATFRPTDDAERTDVLVQVQRGAVATGTPEA